MDVRCPKHGLSLSTEKRVFTFGDKVYPAVIGDCPKCRFSYINRKIFPGDSTTIENKTYQFLWDLEIAFPPESVIDRAVSGAKEGSKKVPDSLKEQTKNGNKQKKEKEKDKKEKGKTRKEKKKEKQKVPEKAAEYRSNKVVLHDSFRFVPKLLTRCPEDGFVLQQKQIQIKTMGVIVKEIGGQCPKCRMVYFHENKKEDIRKKANDVITYRAQKAAITNRKGASLVADAMPTLKEAEKTEVQNEAQYTQKILLPYADDSGKSVNLSRERTTVWVYENKCRCLACERKYQQKTITNRTAVVQNAMRENIYVDVMFCMGCGKHFVNVLTLEMKEKTYGVLMFDRRYTGTLAQKQVSRFNFAEDSILSRYGYSVADKDGISREYRQAILTYIIEAVGIRKNEVEEKIKEFIRIHSKIKGHEAACERWLEDLLFVSDYKIREQKRIANPRFEQVRRKDGRLR